MKVFTPTLLYAEVCKTPSISVFPGKEEYDSLILTKECNMQRFLQYPNSGSSKATLLGLSDSCLTNILPDVRRSLH